MAVNEEIVTGKKFRRLIDVATNKWRRYSFWNKAKDTECEDGTDVETKVGAIKGITTSTNVSETGYAADAKTVSEINQSLTEINNNILMINLPQSDFTWSESYVWRKPYTIPTGYTLEAIEVYATNGDATLSGVYRFIDGKMCICVTGTYLDSTKWTVKPISNSYNFICNLKLRKNN